MSSSLTTGSSGRHRRMDASNDEVGHHEDGDRLPLNHDVLQAQDEREEQSLPLQVIGQIRQNNIPMLTCAFLAALTTGGTTYAFGLYGDALKKSLRLSQPQLDTISTANFCAGLFSWVPGLIVDKFGTRVGLVVGGIQGAVALSLYWTVATQFFVLDRHLLVPTLSTLGVFIFLSCALITGSVFKIIVSTCGPGSKGSAVGVAKGYVGMGSGVYACMFDSIRFTGESDLDFLPMAAFFFVALVTVPSLFMMPSNQSFNEQVLHDETTPNHFRTLYCSLLAMAALIIFNALIELYGDDETMNSSTKKNKDDHDGPNIQMAIFLITIWIGPILSLQLLPKKSTFEEITLDDNETEQESESLLLDGAEGRDDGEISMQRMRKSTKRERSTSPITQGRSPDANARMSPEPVRRDAIPEFLRVSDGTNDQDLVMNSSTTDMSFGSNGADAEDNADCRDSDRNLAQMLQTPTALLMLFTTTILAGGGIMETNNMGQMVEALHFPKDTASASLAFFSVAQSGGRVITGAVSESALNWPTRKFCIDKGVPRTFFLVIASSVGFVAHLLLTFSTTKGVFVIGSLLAGFAFGMFWPLLVLIIGEVFGTANLGANYMFFDGFVSAAGSLLLSKYVAQEVYEYHIDRKGDPDNVTCLGSGCFSWTHAIVSGLSLFCVLTSLCLVFMTRNIYNNRDIHKDT